MLLTLTVLTLSVLSLCRPQYQHPREDLESFVGLKLRERGIMNADDLSGQCRMAKECVMAYLEGIRATAAHGEDDVELDETLLVC